MFYNIRLLDIINYLIGNNFKSTNQRKKIV